MPKVWNKRDSQVPAGAVCVDRTTKWGNPFKIGAYYNGQLLTREMAIAQFRDWLLYSDQGIKLAAEARRPVENGGLRGADLVCWCAPDPCHADVYLEIANA